MSVNKIEYKQKDCCKNCKLYKRLETWTYSSDGVEHKTASGYACLCFVMSDDLVVNLVGLNEEEEGMCEMFDPRK